MTYSNTLTRIARLCCIALLISGAACLGEGGNETAAAKIRQVFEVIDYGKPQAPVRLAYELPTVLAAGDTFELLLDFSSHTAAGSMQVSVNTESGLQLQSGHAAAYDLSDPQKRLALNLLALENGKTYVNVVVLETDETGNPLLGRSFSIPVQIGNTRSKSARESAAATEMKLLRDGDEKIIELPAKLR